MHEIDIFFKKKKLQGEIKPRFPTQVFGREICGLLQLHHACGHAEHIACKLTNR